MKIGVEKEDKTRLLKILWALREDDEHYFFSYGMDMLNDLLKKKEEQVKINRDLGWKHDEVDSNKKTTEGNYLTDIELAELKGKYFEKGLDFVSKLNNK